MKIKVLLEKRFVIAILIAVFVISIISLGWIAFKLVKPSATVFPTMAIKATASLENPDRIASIQITPAPTLTPSLTTEAQNQISPSALPSKQGEAFILSMRDGSFYHLYLYDPNNQPYVKLTNGSWDDVSPAVNPDGTEVVYSSNRNGFWDLYLLDLITGETSQLTVSKEYEGSPTWSPDGLWIAFDRYSNNDLDIFILDVNNLSNPPTQLTEATGVNTKSAWSPQGREIAFSSIQNNQSMIWLAKLDQVSDRFAQISSQTSVDQLDPAWSPNGQYLSWSGMMEGNRFLFVKDVDNPQAATRTIGEGGYSVWDKNGVVLYAVVERPNQTDLVGYNVSDGTIAVPLVHLPTNVKGIDRISEIKPGWLSTIANSGGETLPSNSQVVVNSGEPSSQDVVPLDGIKAPYAFLVPIAKESFFALKSETGAKAGWDFLLTLDNAYIPLTQPPDPGGVDDWLFTGRAISVNSQAIQAGWMAIAREDFSGQVYWQVFIKCYQQDGSMGAPIEHLVWDLSSRSSGNKSAYEEGGQFVSPPSGYWVDFTDLAQDFGWERMPALSIWRSYYPAIRFNQFVLSGGLDLISALSELYPPEALMTYTPIPTNSLINFGTETPHP